MLKRIFAGATAALGALGSSPAAGSPYNGLPPIPSDPAAMALARKAIGTTCGWDKTHGGIAVKGFTSPPEYGWTIQQGGAVYIRQRGPQRVAFMASTDAKICKVLAVEPLPLKSKGEDFNQCSVDSPNASVSMPLSEGLGLLRHGKLAFYLEADFKARTLTPRDPTDARITCRGFESGE